VPINDAFMQGPCPPILVLDALIAKLEKRDKPYGGYYLHDWCEREFGPVKIRAWTGKDPLDEPPLPSECPCVLIVGDENPPFEPHGIGAAEWTIVYTLLMYVYDSDHRKSVQFRWLVTSAVGAPYLNTICPITESTPLLKKWGPHPGLGSGPVPLESRRGSNLWGAKLPLIFTFKGTDLPFFQPGM
jgi:hypothetical protein